MAETKAEPVMKPEPPNLGEPLLVHTHVMPWGFLVALPLAIAFAYLGAWGLDVGLTPEAVASADTPLWLFSLPLLAFSLFLFLMGVGELARYLKPAVEVIVDDGGVTTYDMLGARRMAWGDVYAARIDSNQLSLMGHGKTSRAPRELRLNFNRLAIEPAVLVGRIASHRPDLIAAPPRATGDNDEQAAGA